MVYKRVRGWSSGRSLPAPMPGQRLRVLTLSILHSSKKLFLLFPTNTFKLYHAFCCMIVVYGKKPGSLLFSGVLPVWTIEFMTELAIDFRENVRNCSAFDKTVSRARRTQYLSCFSLKCIYIGVFRHARNDRKTAY